MRILLFFCLLISLATSAQSHNRKIVVFGSSVALGYGSTGNSHGWAFRLGNALQPVGYTVVNRSIPGNNTQALIDRFERDLLPEKPDICIIALGLGNEGIALRTTKVWKDSVYNHFVNGINTLMSMCRKAGIIPIVTGCYPANIFNADDYNYVKTFNALMENSDNPFIEFLGAVDDGTGHFRAGMFHDVLHPNDIGHEAMFRAIPIGIFDDVYNSPKHKSITFSSQKSKGFVQGKDLATSPVIEHPVGALGSFTFSFWANRGKVNPGKSTVLWGLNCAGAPVRLRCPMDSINRWQLIVGPDGAGAISIKTDIGSMDGLWHQFTITYDYHTDSLRLYIDGKFKGVTFTRGQINGATTASLGSRAETGQGVYNPEGARFSSYTFHRVALNASDILKLYKGFVMKGSAEVIAPFSDKEFPAGHSITNVAFSNTHMLVNTAGNSTFGR